MPLRQNIEDERERGKELKVDRWIKGIFSCSSLMEYEGVMDVGDRVQVSDEPP